MTEEVNKQRELNQQAQITKDKPILDSFAIKMAL